MNDIIQKNFFILIVVSSLVLLTGCSQNTDLLNGQAKIQQDLIEIKKLLKQRPVNPAKKAAKPFVPSDVKIIGSPFLGKNDAPITIVEFTDYQCPFCKRHVVNTLPQIIKNYVSTGKVKYVIREFPLTKIHRDAHKLAQAALCAGDQGKYWDMHDYYFKGENKITANQLDQASEAIGLNKKIFNTCLKDGTYANKVDTDLAEGGKIGMRGTPSFFIGRTNTADFDKVRATVMLRGAQPYPRFVQIIDNLITK